MSTAGRILRKDTKNNKWDIEKVINIFMSQGYISYLASGHIEYLWLSVNRPDEQEDGCDDNIDYDDEDYVILYVDYFKKEDETFYYEKAKGNYYGFIFIEDISKKGLILLNFFHEYFKFFPEDIFWNCEKYFYTKEDIDKIYNKGELDPNWLYREP